MAAGEFREDLFFRLSVFPIRVPSLRDRREDIPALASHFLSLLNLPGNHPSLRKDVLEELQARAWPGNVRELRNSIERAAIVARGREIRPEHLPTTEGAPPSRSTPTQARHEIENLITRWLDSELRQLNESQTSESTLYDRLLELVEPSFLREMLKQSRGNRAVAAQQIGIHRSTLRQKLRKYGLE
jgi:two-component system nitrogen regulation response regulator GlnG